jgi:drug/metabolite transporter (DMT)-like permease
VIVPMPVIFAATAMVLFGFADFALKRASDMGVKPHHSVMVQAWFFSSSILTYSLLTGTFVPTSAALWGSAAGLFMIVGYTAFVRSLTGEPVSIQAPVFRLNFIVTAAIAISFLGEPLTGTKALALVLAPFAVWLLLGGGNLAISRRALIYVLVSTVAVGIGNILHKVGLSKGVVPETMAVAQAAVFVSLATLQTFRMERRIAPPKAAFRYPPIAALLLVGAFVFLLRGLALGEASVLVPISQMGFVVTAALGLVLLGERITARKIMGLATATASLGAFMT